MYSILVVDDTIENLDILSILFKDDYDVKVATNGHLAIKIAKSYYIYYSQRSRH